MFLVLWLGGGLGGLCWGIGAVIRSIGMRAGRGGRGGDGYMFDTGWFRLVSSGILHFRLVGS